MAQDQISIDSLKNELNKYEAHKRELGNKITPLMDSMKLNIMYRILVECWYNKPDSGLLIAQQILSLSEMIKYKKGIGNAYNGMGLCYMDKQDYTNGADYFQRALKMRIEIGDKDGQGWTYNNLGLMYGNKSDYKESIKYHLKALKVREEIGDKNEMAATYGKMGHLYFGLGNFPEALKNYFLALKIGEETGDKDQIANSCGDIGQIYYIQGNYKEALKYHQRVFKIGQETGNKFILAASYAYMGNISQKQGNYEDAIKNQLAALQLNRERGDSGSCAFFNYNLALFYQSVENYPEALKYYFASLSEYEFLKINSGIGLLNIEIGGIYEKQGKLQEALKYELKGFTLTNEVGAKDAIKKAYKNLSNIYFGMQDYKNAYTYHVLYQQMKDSLFNDENAEKMKGLQMQYDFDKDEALQKAEQDKKNTLAAKEVEGLKFKRNATYLGLSFVVIILVLVILLGSRIAKERRRKALEDERIRISKDLHDDLGSGLSKISMLSDMINLNTSGEDIRPHLENISRSSKAMVENMGDIIWIMNVKNDKLPSLVAYTRKYAMEFFDTTPIQCIVILPETIPPIQIDGEIRRNIFLVVKEALNNILKHSGADKAELKFNIAPHAFSIIIHDNGKGIDQAKLSEFGNGLVNMEKRMKDIGGKFSIKNEEGTIIEISITV